MGVVIDFPSHEVAPRVRSAARANRVGDVVILPVIRIERYEDKPASQPLRCGIAGGSKRRRRVSRR